MQKIIAPLLVGFCLLFFLISCEKETFSASPQGSVPTIKELPKEIEPYSLTNLSEKESIRNQVAIGLGKAISEDKNFKEELFNLLTDSRKRALVNIPVLKFMNHSFTGGLGKEILNQYIIDSDNHDKSVATQIESLVQSLEPEMTIEIPVFVRSYFLTPETVEMPISDFSDLPLAVFPEVSHTNTQGVMVGYGDSDLTNTDGLYAVYPSGSYEEHIPIHVKRSRNLLVLQNNLIDGRNISVEQYIAGLFPARPPSCLNGYVNGFTDKPDFLEEGKTYFNVASFAKAVPNMCPPVFQMDEICDNGIDDDGDGLIDEGDPDCREEICGNGIDDDGDGLIDIDDPECQVPEICDNGIDDDGDGFIDIDDTDCQVPEICDNGIDDDGDGMIDSADSDCQLTCPESAEFYRDCEVNTDRITGARFASVDWYNNVVNPLLPAIEPNVNLTLNFFRILNISNCETPCVLNRVHTNVTHDAASVFLHGDLLQSAQGSGGLDPVWGDSYEYFESIYDRDLTSGRIAYFLIRAQLQWQDPEPGSIRLGSLGSPDYVGVWSETRLVAYVVTSNWVNYASPFVDDLTRNNGVNYIRSGNTGPSWDASYLGDIVQMDVTQTDVTGVTVQDGTVTTNSNSQSFGVGLNGSVGDAYGFSPGGGGGPTGNNTSSAGFSFNFSNMTTNQVQASTQYTITSERVVPLASIVLRYQDTPDRSIYPSTDYESLYVIQGQYFGTWDGGKSYGHTPEVRATWDREPFSLTPIGSPTNPYQMLGEGDPINLINVIRAPQ